MFKEILDYIKLFLEKNFIQSLVAIAAAIPIYYITPNNFNFLEKIGKELFLFFCFTICFLIIKLLIFVFNTIKEKYLYNKLKKEQENIKILKELHILWDRIDDLEPYQKKLINYVIDNNNAVLNIDGFLLNELFNPWFNQTQTISDGLIKGFDVYNVKETNFIEKGSIVTQYKMKDELFEILKYSKKKYGKISNFD